MKLFLVVAIVAVAVFAGTARADGPPWEVLLEQVGVKNSEQDQRLDDLEQRVSDMEFKLKAKCRLVKPELVRCRIVKGDWGLFR